MGEVSVAGSASLDGDQRMTPKSLAEGAIKVPSAAARRADRDRLRGQP